MTLPYDMEVAENNIVERLKTLIPGVRVAAFSDEESMKRTVVTLPCLVVIWGGIFYGEDELTGDENYQQAWAHYAVHGIAKSFRGQGEARFGEFGSYHLHRLSKQHLENYDPVNDVDIDGDFPLQMISVQPMPPNEDDRGDLEYDVITRFRHPIDTFAY